MEGHVELRLHVASRPRRFARCTIAHRGQMEGENYSEWFGSDTTMCDGARRLGVTLEDGSKRDADSARCYCSSTTHHQRIVPS